MKMLVMENIIVWLGINKYILRKRSTEQNIGKFWEISSKCSSDNLIPNFRKLSSQKLCNIKHIVQLNKHENLLFLSLFCYAFSQRRCSPSILYKILSCSLIVSINFQAVTEPKLKRHTFCQDILIIKETGDIEPLLNLSLACSLTLQFDLVMVPVIYNNNLIFKVVLC